MPTQRRQCQGIILCRRTLLRQPKMVHSFTDGCGPCNDQWRWKVRLMLSATAAPGLLLQPVRVGNLCYKGTPQGSAELQHRSGCA